MARCYQLSADETTLWLQGDGWDAWWIEKDVRDWQARYCVPQEEVVVIDTEHRITFALTANGGRA